jgi:hypothetical protein
MANNFSNMVDQAKFLGGTGTGDSTSGASWLNSLYTAAKNVSSPTVDAGSSILGTIG